MTRPTAHCLLVALFCGAGSAINGYSRWIYTSPDPLAAWRVLSGVDAAVGCLVMLGIIWLARKERG